MIDDSPTRYVNPVFSNKDAVIRQAQHLLDRAGIKAKIVLNAPEWKPGDVVVVRYNGPTAPAYTYVRGMRGWPGERQNKTDAQMNELYAMGKATPVLQSGGVPFSKVRLP